MLAILNSLNAHYFPIFQPILMILVSKFMGHRALSNKIHLSLGLLFPLTHVLTQRDFPKSTSSEVIIYIHIGEMGIGEMRVGIIWAMTQENLSSGVCTQAQTSLLIQAV